MADEEDWNDEDDDDDGGEEEGQGASRRLLIVIIVGVLVIASVGSYVVLREEDEDEELPDEVRVPTLHVGMDWWFDAHGTTTFHDSGEVETMDLHTPQVMVKEKMSYGGKSAYMITSIEAENSTTRHSENDTYYWSMDTLNFIESSDGDETMLFNFPLYDGKTWNWTDHQENNITSVCNIYRNIVTLAGTFDTYRLRATWVEDEGPNRREITLDYYYAPVLSWLAKLESTYDYYVDNALAWTDLVTYDLVLHGTSDSDNDGLSNQGEKWFGTNPGKADSDSDGLSDLEDHAPLLDVGLRIHLTHVNTTDNVESLEETLLFGEQAGADLYFNLSNEETDDVLETEPMENTDDEDLNIQYTFDVPDDGYSVYISIESFDHDSNDPDDTMDITPDDFESRLQLEYRLFPKQIKVDHVEPPDDEMEFDVEKEVSGNGNGDYDATLRFIVSEIDIRDYR